MPLPRSSQNVITGMAHWPEEQHGEPIDLISDTEQERVRLLSAFKTRPVTTGTSKDASKPALVRASQKQKVINKERSLSSQELPKQESNPHERYKRP